MVVLNQLLLVKQVVICISCIFLFINRLQDSPRGLYEVRASIEHKDEPYWLQYTMNELILSDNSTIQHGEPVKILSSAIKETESLEEFDFMDKVKKVVCI